MMLNKSEHIKVIFRRLWDDAVYNGLDLPESAKESVWSMVIGVCFELDNEHQTELAAANAKIEELEKKIKAMRNCENCRIKCTPQEQCISGDHDKCWKGVSL